MWRFPIIASVLLLPLAPCATAQEPHAPAPKGKPIPQSQFNDALPTNCAGLAVILKSEIDRMRKLQERAKKEEKAPPTNLLSAWQRTFGKKGEGIAALNELKKARQRGDNLNEALRAKGCAIIDIDQALAGPASKSR